MATRNVAVSPTPVKAVDANAEFFLSLPWTVRLTVEWASTDTPGVAPTATQWHPLRGEYNDKLNRVMLGHYKELWVRSPEGPTTIIVE
jgi:hypothetical protein